MGLTPWKLLEYFSVDELKLVLSKINEPQTGNRDALVERVIIEWPQHNKHWYHLLGYLDTPTLRMICNDFDLDKTGTRDLLAQKIKKELDKNALPKQKSKETSHQFFVMPHSRRDWGKISVMVTVVGIIIASIFYFFPINQAN